MPTKRRVTKEEYDKCPETLEELEARQNEGCVCVDTAVKARSEERAERGEATSAAPQLMHCQLPQSQDVRMKDSTEFNEGGN